MIEIRQILGSPRPGRFGPKPGRALLAGLCAVAALASAGCGQKGPLYLPDGQISTAPAPTPIHSAKTPR